MTIDSEGVINYIKITVDYIILEINPQEKLEYSFHLGIRIYN